MMSVAFILKNEGPGTVYTGDLQPMDPEIIPAFPTIPLAKMVEGQGIELEAWATVGTAKEHAKWQAGHAYYKELEDGSYEMTVESFGQMPAKELVRRAAMIVGKKSEEFKIWVESKGVRDSDTMWYIDCAYKPEDCEIVEDLDDREFHIW